jgi:aspartate/methionine/tyrosine aminotransferase
MRQFPASPITALVDGSPRYNLGESYGPHLRVADLLDPDELAKLAALSLGYASSAGDAGLRIKVAGRLGIGADQILITSGAAAALFLLGLVHGDGEILVGRPCFPPVLDTLQGTGARVVTMQGRFEDGYRIDLDAFEHRLSAKTRLAMFASPQSPAGVTITRGEVDGMLAAMARRCPEAVLLIDETYREATYGDAPPMDSFAGYSPQILTCTSLSKAHGVPGLRIGWLTVPQDGLREQLRLAKFNSTVSCGIVDEFLASRVLDRADQVLIARGGLMAAARATVGRWVAGTGGRLQWLRPQAGAFCCVRLNPDVFGPQDVRRFHDRLAAGRTVVAPGPWFGDSAHVLRLGLAYEPAHRLEQGLDVIAGALPH